MMEIIQMTDYLFEQLNNRNSIGKSWINVCNYAKLLKQPLKLEMFIHCDKYGNLLDRPKAKELTKGTYNYAQQNIWDEKNKDAVEKILFHTKFEKDGSYFFKSIKGSGTVEYNPNTKRFYFGLKTIEDLCCSGIELYTGWEEKIKNL